MVAGLMAYIWVRSLWLTQATSDLSIHLSSQVHWIFKNKDQGKTAAVASIGLINLWDVDGGLPMIDKYMYSRDPYVQAGAGLAVGMICTRINHENDPAFALLFELVENTQQIVRLPSILGMGLAYADANKVSPYPLLPIFTWKPTPNALPAVFDLSGVSILVQQLLEWRHCDASVLHDVAALDCSNFMCMSASTSL